MIRSTVVLTQSLLRFASRLITNQSLTETFILSVTCIINFYFNFHLTFPLAMKYNFSTLFNLKTVPVCVASLAYNRMYLIFYTSTHNEKLHEIVFPVASVRWNDCTLSLLNIVPCPCPIVWYKYHTAVERQLSWWYVVKRSSPMLSVLKRRQPWKSLLNRINPF